MGMGSGRVTNVHSHSARSTMTVIEQSAAEGPVSAGSRCVLGEKEEEACTGKVATVWEAMSERKRQSTERPHTDRKETSAIC